MSQNLVEQLAARRRARGQALNSTLLAVMKEKDDSSEKTVVSPPSKKIQRQSGASNSGEKSIELDELLNTKSAKEMESKRIGEEIEILLGTQTTREKSLAKKFRSNDAVKEFCDFQTRERCPNSKCVKLHFEKIIKSHTQEHLGDCSFLNNCFNHDSCKYVHYRIEGKAASIELT